VKGEDAIIQSSDIIVILQNVTAK